MTVTICKIIWPPKLLANITVANTKSNTRPTATETRKASTPSIWTYSSRNLMTKEPILNHIAGSTLCSNINRSAALFAASECLFRPGARILFIWAAKRGRRARSSLFSLGFRRSSDFSATMIYTQQLIFFVEGCVYLCMYVGRDILKERGAVDCFSC